MNRLLWLQGALFVIPGALTPVLTVLESVKEITSRTIACMVVGAIIGACIAWKAFISTIYADTPGRPVGK